MSQLSIVSPAEYFQGQVTDACSVLKRKLPDEIEFYLVTLLCNFIDSPGISHHLHTPLALQLKIALESDHADKFKILKGLGYISLYFAGFFQEYFTGRAVDINYYIAMGANAYFRISEAQSDKHFSEIYRLLGDEFSGLVDIVATIADKQEAIKKDSSLIALYEKWARTGSTRIQKILEEQGFNLAKPNRNKISS